MALWWCPCITKGALQFACVGLFIRDGRDEPRTPTLPAKTGTVDRFPSFPSFFSQLWKPPRKLTKSPKSQNRLESKSSFLRNKTAWHKGSHTVSQPRYLQDKHVRHIFVSTQVVKSTAATAGDSHHIRRTQLYNCFFICLGTSPAAQPVGLPNRAGWRLRRLSPPCC